MKQHGARALAALAGTLLLLHVPPAFAATPAPGSVIPAGTPVADVMPCQPLTPPTSQHPHNGYVLHPGETWDQFKVDSKLLVVDHGHLTPYADRFGSCRAPSPSTLPGGVHWLLAVYKTQIHHVGYTEDPQHPDEPYAWQERTEMTGTGPFNVRFTTSASFKPTFREQFKAVLLELTNTTAAVAAYASAAFTDACPLAPAACAAAAAAIATEAIADAVEWFAEAVDPADRDFNTVVRPPHVTLPRVPAAGGPLPVGVAHALNAFTATAERQQSLEQALDTTLNRLQGAHLARAHRFEALQLHAARRFARRLSMVTRKLPTVLRSLRGAWLGAGLVDPIITSETLAVAQGAIAEHGLDPAIRQALRTAGFGGRQLATATATITTADLAGARTTTLFDVLTSPRLLAGISADARGLAGFATRGH